jgi:lysozyme
MLFEDIKKPLVPWLKKFEGFASTPYLCTGGYKTIGYGHQIQKGDVFLVPLSNQQADALLEQDIKALLPKVQRLIKGPLTTKQWCALLSFSFNVGTAALQRSTLRLKVNRQEHKLVPQEFMKWIWAGGKPSKGLKGRRFKEGLLYEEGTLP